MLVLWLVILIQSTNWRPRKKWVEINQYVTSFTKSKMFDCFSFTKYNQISIN